MDDANEIIKTNFQENKLFSDQFNLFFERWEDYRSLIGVFAGQLFVVSFH